MRLSPAQAFFLLNDLPQLLRPFEQHRIEGHAVTDIGRLWRCRSPRSSAYQFDVLSMPGKLFLTGDMGDMLLKGFTCWGHEWLCQANLQVTEFAERIATWPAGSSGPEVLLPWLGWHLAAEHTFRRLLAEAAQVRIF